MPTHRSEFLIRVERACRKYGVMCHAYSVLTTHYHLLVTPMDANLDGCMQWLNARYAEWFNRRHDTHGHVWGATYRRVHVDNDAHLLHLIWYLAHNPVDAGLCRHVDEWPWSSYLALLGEFPPGFLSIRELLRLLGRDPAQARRRIEAYVGRLERAA